jgi:hypothetical protein
MVPCSSASVSCTATNAGAMALPKPVKTEQLADVLGERLGTALKNS